MLATGIIDSFGVAEVIALLEERYGVRLPVEEIGVDTADTPEDLAALIAAHAR
jgi:acyl carrier protein